MALHILVKAIKSLGMCLSMESSLNEVTLKDN